MGLPAWWPTCEGCENKSLAFPSRFTSLSRVLPTSRVGYQAGKPIESVVYRLNKLAVSINQPRSQVLSPTHLSLPRDG